jgi:hypothetical protein
MQNLPTRRYSIISFLLAVTVVGREGEYVSCNQWGRKLEGWSSTAACPAGWRRVSRQVWFCTWWMGRTAFLFLTVPVALTGAAHLRAGGISSCCYIVNVHNHPSWATSCKEGMVWYSSRPWLLSVCNTLQRYWTENWKKIFPERKLRGLSPNFYIHIYVCDLYIPTIGLLILPQENTYVNRLWDYINRHRCMSLQTGTEAAQFDFWKYINRIFFAVQYVLAFLHHTNVLL